MQVLLQIDRARPGKLRTQHSRDERPTPHAMRNHTVEQGVICILRIKVRGIRVARHRRKSADVIECQRASQRRTLTNDQLIEGVVLGNVDIGCLVHGIGRVFQNMLRSIDRMTACININGLTRHARRCIGAQEGAELRDLFQRHQTAEWCLGDRVLHQVIEGFDAGRRARQDRARRHGVNAYAFAVPGSGAAACSTKIAASLPVTTE